jgi:ATP-dependent exoDNAse (exonuclease V) beta subunit
MTVHKAKGLEFPVVILGDVTCRLSRDDASRYLDADRRLCAVRIGGWAPHELHDHEAEEIMRDRAEGVRLSYVAATRARDMLVVPAIGDEPWDGGWLSPLNGALYPTPDAPQSVTRPPKCPPLKSKDSVLVRPDDRLPHMATVAPGLHAFGGYTVTWWDPRWLTLGLKPAFGVRRQELIMKEAARDVVDAGRQRYDAWQDARQAARASGATPSTNVATAREYALRDHPKRDGKVPVLEIQSASPRSGGAAFGLLVHAVLADVPLDGAAQLVDDVARRHGRALGASESDVAAAADAARRALAHDLLDRARAADARGRCRRESPVVHRLGDGTLVEGIVDLAFEEDGRWIVVDFKTDRELGEQLDVYTRQVRVYADAIAAATGKHAEAVLMKI